MTVLADGYHNEDIVWFKIGLTGSFGLPKIVTKGSVGLRGIFNTFIVYIKILLLFYLSKSF